MREPAINDAWRAADEFLRDASNIHAYLPASHQNDETGPAYESKSYAGPF